MLKPFYTAEADIPEAVKSLYVEKDGRWVLEVEGMVSSEEMSSLRSKVDEFRQNNITLNEKLKNFDGKKVLTAEEQEEFARLVKQQEDIEDKKLIDAGKIDELLANRTEKMRKDYEGRITSLEDSLAKEKQAGDANRQRLSKVMIRSEVSQLLSDQGIVPVKGALEDIYARAAATWRVDDESGALQAVNGAGDKVYGSEGKELTLVEWGQGLVKDAPYLFSENKGSGGQGGGAKPPTGGDGIIRIPRGDEALKSKHIADIASGKAVVVD